MASTPERRKHKEIALAQGETTEQETPVKPIRKIGSDGRKLGHLTKWQTRERMMELHAIRKEKVARGEIEIGRPRTKFSKAEREDRALERLMPKALKVLQEQLEDDDPRVRQAAAIKVIEYRKGRPTQMVKQEIDQRISAIRFETAALDGNLLAPPLDLPVLEAVVEDEDEDEDADGEAD